MAAREIRPIPGYPGYFVSDDGRVFSDFIRGSHAGRRQEGLRRELRPGVTPVGEGYKCVALSGATKYIHQLVALAFIGQIPPGQEVRHLNGDSFDNRRENLAYGTRRQNVDDMQRHGRMRIGARHPFAKLNAERVQQMRSARANGVMFKDIAKAHGVSFATAYNAITGKTWRSVP